MAHSPFPKIKVVSLPTQKPSDASRVVRTLHQALLAGVALFPPFVVIAELPASTAARISAALVLAVTGVSKAYNVLFPTAEPLDDET